MIHPLNSWPRGPLVIFPSCWDCSKLLAIPELRINHRMGEDKWVHELAGTCWPPSPTLEKKLQNCVQHWHRNANLKFQGSNLKTAVEFAFKTHGADNRKGWVGPVLTKAQTCNLPLLWANMFGLRTRIQRTRENRMKPGIVAEPCCLPTGMCVCWWNLLFLVSSILFLAGRKSSQPPWFYPRAIHCQHQLRQATGRWRHFNYTQNLWSCGKVDLWRVKMIEDGQPPTQTPEFWRVDFIFFFITSIHVYPRLSALQIAPQPARAAIMFSTSCGTWWSHPGAWNWGANKIQLQFGTIWSSSPCNNLGFHVKSWFVRCIPSIKQGSMATQLGPTSINRAH